MRAVKKPHIEQTVEMVQWCGDNIDHIRAFLGPWRVERSAESCALYAHTADGILRVEHGEWFQRAGHRDRVWIINAAEAMNYIEIAEESIRKD